MPVTCRKQDSSGCSALGVADLLGGRRTMYVKTEEFKCLFRPLCQQKVAV